MIKTTFSITLSANRHSLEGLFPLLQYGIEVSVDRGHTIHSLLTDHYGIDTLYIKRFISTVLLDGKPVDDPASTAVSSGSTIALSGAMPGLAGAVLRSGSKLGSFRHSITHCGGPPTEGAEGVILKLKLFNRIMREAGAAFLAKGIRLPSALLAGYLQDLDASFWEGISYAGVNGKRIEPGKLLRKVKDNRMAYAGLTAVLSR